MFLMKGTKKIGSFPLNLDHCHRVGVSEVALRLIIFPLQAGRMCLPFLNVAQTPPATRQREALPRMAAIAAIAILATANALAEYILHL